MQKKQKQGDPNQLVIDFLHMVPSAVHIDPHSANPEKRYHIGKKIHSQIKDSRPSQNGWLL